MTTKNTYDADTLAALDRSIEKWKIRSIEKWKIRSIEKWKIRSIEKWKNNATIAETYNDNLIKDHIILGPENCALCQKFNQPSMDVDGSCVGCPISEKTGQKFCEGTPYDYIDTFSAPFGMKLVALVKEEVEFLENLREELK